MKKIRFRDNLFYLRVKIRAIGDGLRLGVDGNLFGQEMVREFCFIHSTIEQLSTVLQKRSNLVRREDYLCALFRVQRGFVETLESFLSSPNRAAPGVVEELPRLNRFAADTISRMKVLHKDIEKEDGSAEAGFLSGRELTLLLSSPEGKEQQPNSDRDSP